MWSLLILVVFLWVVVKGAISSGYDWQWYRVWPYFFKATDSGFSFGPLVASGLVATIRISAQSLVLSLCVGMATAVLRLMGGPVTRVVCAAYVECVRNTPLMVQLISVYALMPADWGLSAENIAVLVFGLFQGAYIAEIFRAGIAAVPAGQWEAAVSLGLPPGMALRHVILPQAVRHSLPPLVSQSVSLVKDSSLASVIAVSELAQQSGLVVSDTFLSFEVWLPVAGIYLILAFILSGLASWLEKRLNRGIAAGHREQAQPVSA